MFESGRVEYEKRLIAAVFAFNFQYLPGRQVPVRGVTVTYRGITRGLRTSANRAYAGNNISTTLLDVIRRAGAGIY